ncbi:MAG TPA: UDP-N-acetylglucosamine 4,6-dehydratase (inverting) [candidate division Zixibacteria bacterium]|nr:UDP-N-acetylglucosamine 4,6-dehydratase (inverting) [candidate division Zixibacteria bacterium]
MTGKLPVLKDKVVLVTGGTGSFGKQFVATVLREGAPKKLIVFSRDELKQFDMRQQFSEERHPCMRYFIGDVRDRERLYRAMDGVDIVIHAAALKQVPTAEYNPLEVIKTNVLGGANIIDAAIDRNVEKVIALSTDKAANPINLYGATKLCSDKLFVAANGYSGRHGTRFSVVRYGNVLGSRGSVIPLFRERRRTGVLPVTDPKMTRFWITLEQAVQFVLSCLERMRGGEIFVPKIPSMKIVDLARALAPECRLEVVGIRPGEKLHETMVPEDDARNTVEYEDCFVIYAQSVNGNGRRNGGRPCPEGFRYSSDTNSRWLTVEELRQLVGGHDS